MRLPVLTSIALAAALAAFALPAQADSSVAARLKSRGLQYEVDADGDYKVLISYSKEKRTQLVFVSGATEQVSGFVVREVFSPAARVDRDGVGGARALALLKESRGSKLGAWEIGGDVLYFVIKLPDDVSAAQLEQAIEIAAQSADDMEIELSGDDDQL